MCLSDGEREKNETHRHQQYVATNMTKKQAETESQIQNQYNQDVGGIYVPALTFYQ